MKDQSKSPRDGEQRKAKHHGNKGMASGRKVTLTKESVKRYRVTLIYVPVSDEEAKMKRAIIETIMKKPSHN